MVRSPRLKPTSKPRASAPGNTGAVLRVGWRRLRLAVSPHDLVDVNLHERPSSDDVPSYHRSSVNDLRW